MLTLLFTTVLASWVPNAPPGIDETELKKFQGKWSTVEVEHGGKKVPAKEIADWTLDVTGKVFISRDGTEVKDEMILTAVSAKDDKTLAGVTFKITSGSDKDKTIDGIWKIEGDKLTFCLAEPGKKRPEIFTAQPGTGLTLLVFQKNKK